MYINKYFPKQLDECCRFKIQSRKNISFRGPNVTPFKELDERYNCEITGGGERNKA